MYNLLVGSYRILTLIFLGALVLRLSLLFVAYHGDLNNNISWATLAVERGLDGFYDPPSQSYGEASWPYSAPNQPPLTILMLAATRVIWIGIEKLSWFLNNRFSFFPSTFIWFWEGKGMTLLVKLPSTMADLGIGLLIYKYFAQRNKEKLGFKLSALWLFNPITWYNSAIWGQTDGIVNLLGLIGIFALLNKNLIKFAIFIVLSVLFKGSLAIFAPVLLFVAYTQKYSLKKWLQATIYMLVTAFLVSIWFHPRIDLPVWLINLYRERILPGEIGYLTANAFNFWLLIDSGKRFDSTVYLGLPARLWGFAVVLTGIILVMIWLKRKISERKIFISLIITSLLSFLFLTRIHERYLYPFFPYGTILLGFLPHFWIPYIILSATHLLNLYHLFWAPPLPWLESLYQNSTFSLLISFVNLFTFAIILRHLKLQKI